MVGKDLVTNKKVILPPRQSSSPRSFAAATIDCEHDAADLADAERGKQPIECPLLVLWAKGSPFDEWYDPLAIWRRWAGNVSGNTLEICVPSVILSPQAHLVSLASVLTASCSVSSVVVVY